MDSGQLLDFEQQLRRQLAGELPGPTVQRQLAPELAFGRHRGPVPAESRQAAVLMLVHPSQPPRHAPLGRAVHSGERTTADDWSIVAIVRPAHMKFHPGQIALPGGMVEPGETLQEAALREFEEELGVSAATTRVLGRMSPVYVFASGALVTPFVAISEAIPEWKPSVDEVAGVLDIRLSELLKPSTRGTHTIRRGQFTMQAPHYRLAERQVWGATAMILAEFAAICSAARLRLTPDAPALTPDAT